MSELERLRAEIKSSTYTHIYQAIKELNEESPDKGYRRIWDDLEHYRDTKVNDKPFIDIRDVIANTVHGDYVREVMKNGKVVDILDNGVSSQGDQSYEYIIDAGKKIGTKDETHVKVILSDDGGMITAYPFNIEGGMRK